MNAAELVAFPNRPHLTHEQSDSIVLLRMRCMRVPVEESLSQDGAVAGGAASVHR